MLEAVLCSQDGFVKNEDLSDVTYEVFDMFPANKERKFSMKTIDQKRFLEFSSYFKELQLNTLEINFSLDNFVKWEFKNAKKKGADVNVFIQIESAISKNEARRKIGLVLENHPEYVGKIIISLKQEDKIYFWGCNQF